MITEKAPIPGSVSTVLPNPILFVEIPTPAQSYLIRSTLQPLYKKLFGFLVIILSVLFPNSISSLSGSVIVLNSTPSISKVDVWLYNQVSNLGPETFSPR